MGPAPNLDLIAKLAIADNEVNRPVPAATSRTKGSLWAACGEDGSREREHPHSYAHGMPLSMGSPVLPRGI
jgi:hypothetical protein